MRAMLLKRINIYSWQQLRKYSALYLTGDKAREEYASVHPYLDFKGILGDRKGLQENLAKRKSQINLTKLYEQWDKYRKLQEEKSTLERKRIDIAESLKNQALREEEIERLKAEGKALRNTLKDLKENSYNFEEEFINKFLEIPNGIHPRTQEGIIFDSPVKDEVPAAEDQCHSMVSTVDDHCLYSRGDLARFEFMFPIYCQKFLAKKGFVYFANPDFVRSVIVEAAGVDKGRLFRVLEDDAESKINLLHLSGGGSMMSFLSYITRLSIFSTQLPLSLVANGRTYSRAGDSRSQGNSVQAFCATSTVKEAEEKFDELTADLQEIYGKFEQHFRMIYASPEKLDSSEMMRLSLEMLSTTNGDYKEVASVSFHGDYLSKRLLFNYKSGKETHFPNIVTATFVDTSQLSIILMDKHKDKIKELLRILK
ncbi:serine--tRNA synthetase-like protein Slimp [Lutzomyia longipalpis]|uniref:serine--tRNA synthetase-like protein Slimp n=1 Tax=Lutzomyia longipalpis TaxID=7200 RepID=UPI0024846FF3|nr:serine--tRNA synthetase-like protein Slimp [Lutzomyia longipalpis]